MNNGLCFFTTALLLAPTSWSQTTRWGLVATDTLRAQKMLISFSAPVLVAVIDTGIDSQHEVLKERIWLNPGETGIDSAGHNKATNGIDDDNNGFVDDIQGWNFASNSNSLTDHHGHGTHISGIITSVAPSAKIMVLKYYDPQSVVNNNIGSTVKAIRYAIQMHANIINFSGGGFGKNKDEEEALQDAQRAGILVVAAAGNEGQNSDINGYYPADYDLDNIISVASLDQNLKLLPSSNFGKKTVDISAPGSNILSSLPGNLHGKMTGTSQATAFVSGAAALLMSQMRNKSSYSKIKQQLLATAVLDPELRCKSKTGVRLNSYLALAMKDQSNTAMGNELAPSQQGFSLERLSQLGL